MNGISLGYNKRYNERYNDIYIYYITIVTVLDLSCESSILQTTQFTNRVVTILILLYHTFLYFITILGLTIPINNARVYSSGLAMKELGTESRCLLWDFLGQTNRFRPEKKIMHALSCPYGGSPKNERSWCRECRMM